MYSAPPSTIRGGGAIAAGLLQTSLQPFVDILPFRYGRRTDDEAYTVKVLNRITDLFRAYLLMRRDKPDLIHLNSAFDPRAMVRDAAFVSAARCTGIPVFLVLHGSLDKCFSRSSRVLEPVRQVLLRNVARIGVLSRSEQMVFQRVFPFLQNRVEVIKNIIHPRFLESVPQPAVTPHILFISRFLRAKGPFDILHAIPHVLAETREAKFIFAGDGPDRSKFQAEVSRMEISQAVIMLDNVPNEQTPELYRQAWVLVLPSHFPEGLPMVVAEAMACGLPLITTRMRFAESYLRERENVLYVPHGDSNAIAARILELLRKPGLRARMSTANRQLAKSLFSADIVTAEFVSIYNRIGANLAA